MSKSQSALLTDLYQLTMLQAYFDEGMADTAVFEFFVRALPPGRNFLLAAGLEQVLAYLEQFRVTNAELDWLRAQSGFSEPFLAALGALRFSGDVHALPEGTPCFINEPMLRITAPISQAQVVESRLLSLLHLSTLIASKAARSVLAAPGKLLVDFGMRRAHGAEAGLLAARSAYLAGFSGTATVQAGIEFGIPVFGTMAHSYIEAHADEISAFRAFAHSSPANVVLLIDTYDTERAAEKVVLLAPELAREGIRVRGVRLDSGDLAAHARAVRSILDAGGLHEATIFSSGNLDELKVQQLLAAGAPIDGFGIGTALDTSSDAPFLDCAYKLQEYAGTPRRKHSEGKATWPGRKQVYRHYAPDGTLDHDVVALEGDAQQGTPLLVPVMHAGRRVAAAEPLAVARARAAAEMARLPPQLKSLQPASVPYRVDIAPGLRALAEELDRMPH
ncbi:MAG: nicotinate phosphoribosyltransferase [Burkholderiales bacterium]